MPNPKIYIIDDNLDMCMALSNFFDTAKIESKFYHDSSTFLTEYKSTWRGCILLDILMPDLNGLEILTILKQKNNQMPVIILTGYNNVPVAVQAMRIGASDFITKPFDSNKLLDKIKKLMAENYSQAEQQEDTLSRIASLTAREREVMALIISGKLNKQIASILDINIKTVEVHRSRIMNKLKTRNITELVRLGLSISHSDNVKFSAD